MTTQTKSFNQIFEFLAHLYRGNWEYRWGQVPFMDQDSNSLKGESILAHQWSCITLWMLLKDQLPALSKLVDSARLYECLAIHDIGEIVVGDVPKVEQLKVGSNRKQEIERREIDTDIENLPPELQTLIRNYYHDYTFEEKPDITTLLARYLDNMQGNHFGLVYGKDLSKYSALISKIVDKYFLPIAKKLFDLASSLDPKAGNEIQSLTDYHLEAIRKAGITLRWFEPSNHILYDQNHQRI